jgi:ankyrin repeat protein
MGGTPLRSAADTGKEDAVRALLARGADPRTRDKYGRTASDYARDNGHGVIVKLLSEAEARLR